MMMMIIIIIIKFVVPSGTYVVYEFLPFSPVSGNRSQLPPAPFPSFSASCSLVFLSFWDLGGSTSELLYRVLGRSFIMCGQSI
jgi:hypothetical protein